MQRVTFLFFAFAIMSFSHDAYSQYLPIGILPMEYNPSFAGSVGNSRIVSNFIYKEPYDGLNYSVSGLYEFDLSYDNYFPALRSGIGIVTKVGSYDVDRYSGIDLKIWNTSTELAIAPKISINGKYTLSPSMSLKYNKFFTYHTETWHRSSDNFYSKFGLLFNASHYYIGYAAEYHYGSSGLTTALQFGYTFQKSIDSKFSFTPQFALPIIISPGIYVYWPSYNLSFRYGSFILGAISQFEYTYPTGFQLGWQNKGWRILLSNDFTDRYISNLTLRYIFNHDKKSIHIFY